MAACNIKIGKHEVHPDKVAEALQYIKGVSDFNVAVIRSYSILKEDIPLGAWEKYVANVWESVPKSRKINEKDLVGDGEVTSEVTELKDILNREKYSFETARGEIQSGLSPEAIKAIGIWKKHLINRGEVLNQTEIKRILKSIKSVVESGKREARLEQMKNSAKRSIKKKIGTHGSYPVFRDLLTIPIKHLKNFTGNTPGYSKAEMLKDYREVLEALSVRKRMYEYTKEEISDITSKADKIIQTIGEVPQSPEGIKADDPKERAALLERLETLKGNPEELVLRDERGYVEELNQLSESDLEALNNHELMDLANVLRNVNEGLFHAQIARKLLYKVKENRAVETSADVFRNTEKTDWANAWGRAYGKAAKFWHKGSKEYFYYLFRASATTYSGTVVGDAQNRLSREVTRELETASEKVDSFVEGLLNRNDKVSNKLGHGKARVKKIYATSILSFHRQHQTNKDQWSAAQLVDSFIENGLNNDNVNIHTVELMKELKNEFFKDGNLDVSKLERYVIDGKGGQALLEFNEKNGEQMVPYLITAASARGETVPVLNNHSPYRVLWTPSAGAVDPDEKFAKRMTPGSTRASGTHERIKAEAGKTAPVVDFDLLTASTQSAHEIITDYHLTEPIKVAYNSASKALETLVAEKADKLNIEAAKGWKQFIHNKITQHLSKQASPYSLGKQVMDGALKASYSAKLVRKDKFVSEVVGQVAWWGFNHPKNWIRGTKSAAAFRKDYEQIINNIGSSQTTKLTKKGVWTGKEVDPGLINQNKGKRQKNKLTGYDDIKGVRSQGASILMKPGNVAAHLSSEALSLPDRATNRPGHIGTFEFEFEKLTGIALGRTEYDLIAINNEEFMRKHGENLRKAMVIADEISVRAANTTNQFNSLDRFKIEQGDGWGAGFQKVASGWLMNFTINEAASFKYYFRTSIGREEGSKFDGVKGMSAVLVRMAMYRPIMTASAITFAMLGIGSDDDKDYGDVLNEFIRDLAGSFFTLTVQGRQGSWQREPTSWIIEGMNEKYFGFLRDGQDYKEFDHGLMFRLVRDRDLGYRATPGSLLLKFSGAPGAVMKDLWYVKKQYDRSDSLTDQDFMIDLALFVGAYVYQMPGYRDVHNQRTREAWKLKQANKKKTVKRNKSKSRKGVNRSKSRTTNRNKRN